MRERQELALALGTMFCGVHTIGEFDRRALIEGPGYASPMDFANTVINAAAGQTAIWHNLRGINSTIAAGTASGLHAIAYGVELIRTGQCVAVLAGGADELCVESFYGFERSSLLCPTGDLAAAFPIPFDVRRNGFVPAEGAGFVVLEEESFATRRGGRVRGRIAGVGAGFDSSLGRSEAMSIRAISHAITGAMDDAGTEPDRIGCLSASANGSIALDRHEAWGILHALNGRAQTLPVTAVKGALGEAMGASGPAQVVALIESMSQGVLPGIRDLQTDPDLPLRQLAGENRTLGGREALVNSVGLDGNCCCLVVQAGPATVERTRGSHHV
jgi:3-oxoacyl-[acyl-carrier-protein] synthase II